MGQYAPPPHIAQLLVEGRGCGGQVQRKYKTFFLPKGREEEERHSSPSPLKERLVCASTSDMMQYCNFRLHVKAKLGIAYYYTSNTIYAVCSMYVM